MKSKQTTLAQEWAVETDHPAAGGLERMSPGHERMGGGQASQVKLVGRGGGRSSHSKERSERV